MPEKHLTMRQIAGRICDRESNIYSEKIVYDILNKCMDECKKGLLSGERVQLTGISTIIPLVKTQRRSNCRYLPTFNQDNVSQPYTKIKISRNNAFVQEMNKTLLKNIENGIMGLEQLPFDKQQITILKDSGFIPDEENENDEYEEE